MSVTSGLTSAMPFATWDRDSRCWRTSEVTSLWALTLSSLTLPTSGGLRSGSLYEHPTPALPTNGSGFSSLPTPTSRDHKGANQRRDTSCLHGALLPTPTSQAAKHGETPDTTANGYGSNLWDITTLLPTPAVNDMGEGKTVEHWNDWTESMKAKHGNGNGHGRSLAIEAQRLLPTPVADHSRGLPSEGTDYSSLPNAVVALLPTPSVADGTGGHLTRSGDRSGELLLPGVVKTLLPTPVTEPATGNGHARNLGKEVQSLGANTPPPSPDGRESSDVPLPFPPSQGEQDHPDSPQPSSSG